MIACDTSELAALSRDVGIRLTHAIRGHLRQDIQSDLTTDEKLNLLFDACSLHRGSLDLLNRYDASVLGVFRKHLRRAHAARAETFVLLARHFCGSKEAATAWNDLEPNILLSSSLPTNVAVSVVKERDECLQRVADVTRECLRLCCKMSKTLHQIVDSKPETYERLDTLSCLDEEQTELLKSNVRGFSEDIYCLTEQLDSTVRLPSFTSGCSKELLSGQKRFIYALIDVMEGSLHERLGEFLSISQTPNHLPLSVILDELDALIDRESHPFLTLAGLRPDSAILSQLESLSNNVESN